MSFRTASFASAFALATVLGMASPASAAPPDGVYRVSNACSGKALEVLGGRTENSSRVVIWTWENEEHQKWRLETLTDGKHRLVAVHSGKVLDASSQVREDNTPLFHQHGWNSGQNQRFAVTDAGNGDWRLTVQHNQKVLDVRGAGTADGATVWQWDWNASCAQRWRFERLDGGTGTPIATEPAAGNGQTATVGTAVLVRPAMQVRDTNGGPVAGVPVTFKIVKGGGSLTGTSTTTNALGIATVGSWTLGNVVGAQSISGSTPGLPEVVFTATATPVSGTGSLQPDAAADDQTATVGTVVAKTPWVVVRSASGNPVSGVTVTFSIASGGGQLGQGSDVSDANGRADSGSWTLGPTTGTQTLTAAAPGYGSTTFSATALQLTAPTVARSVFMTDVYEVWDIAFTPDGTMLYSERGRGLKARLANGDVRTLFAPADFVPEDNSGMLGIAVDPAFATNRRVYVYMSSNADGAKDNRVVRLKVNADFSAVTERADIVKGISYQRSSQNGGRHSGGEIDFGPDGFLYVTTGDIRTGSVPQNGSELGGKVLRVDTNGAAASGNNAPNAFDARILAYGFRNPQGLAMRPGVSGVGAAYLIEHGPGNNDEVTRLSASGNGGWDPRPRPLGSSLAKCPNGSQLDYCGYEGANMTDTELYPSALAPVWSSGNPAKGTGGGDFITGSAWKAWNGALVIAQLAGRRLVVLQLNAAGTAVVAQTPLLETLNVRLRAVVRGPDGALYVSTSSDNNKNGLPTEIWKLTPQ